MTKCCATPAHWGLGLIVFTLFFTAPVLGNTFPVNNTFDSGPGSLRDAIASTSTGDTIIVNVTGTISLTSGPLLIRKDLTIVGPGPSALVIAGNGSSRILTIGDVGAATVVLSGLTITNGHANYGGGILNGGNLRLTNTIVSSNAADFYGGAIYNTGTVTLLDSIVSSNTAGYYGGGLYTESGSTMTIGGSSVSNNTASVGGGITNHDGTLSVLGSTVSDNTAGAAHGGSGGGMYNGGLGGTVRIANSTFSRNVAFDEGGGIYTGSGTVTVFNSTVSNNSSPCNSGGCSGGGGIYTNSSGVSITSSTLSGNVSLQGGNVISLYATTTLKNTILSKGSSGPNCYTYTPNAIVSDGNNLSDDASCSNALTQPGDRNSTPAGLSPRGLQDNGGPTQTIALLATSPAVDGVTLSACTDADGNFYSDQRGVPRPQSVACDIGALELTLHPTTLALAAPSPSSLLAGSMGPVTLTAVLTRPDTSSSISGASITFSIDGTVVGTATTDSTGAGTVSYNPSILGAGSHVVQAFFGRQTIDDTAFETSSSAPDTLQIEPSPYAASIQPPVRADGTSVFNVNRGVVPVKFTLTYAGAATCDLVPASIALSRTAGSAGPVSEDLYALAADSGSSFRIDTGACQYVYNLATSSLGTGTYAVYITIDGAIVGTGTFGVQ